jgi:hypothetical protein
MTQCGFRYSVTKFPTALVQGYARYGTSVVGASTQPDHVPATNSQAERVGEAVSVGVSVGGRDVWVSVGGRGVSAAVLTGSVFIGLLSPSGSVGFLVDMLRVGVTRGPQAMETRIRTDRKRKRRRLGSARFIRFSSYSTAPLYSGCGGEPHIRRETTGKEWPGSAADGTALHGHCTQKQEK